MKRLLATAAVIGASLVLAGCGSPDPLPFTTAPPVCTQALNAADKVNQIDNDAWNAQADFTEAASRYDLLEMDQSSSKLQSYIAPLQQALRNYEGLAEGCRAVGVSAG